jgi:hypothetical protein
MSKNVMKNVWDSKKKEQERLDKVKAKRNAILPQTEKTAGETAEAGKGKE